MELLGVLKRAFYDPEARQHEHASEVLAFFVNHGVLSLEYLSKEIDESWSEIVSLRLGNRAKSARSTHLQE